VPLILAYADGATGGGDTAAVAETRALMRGIDWTEVRLTERPENLGLGRNVLAGITEVAARHEAFVVWEDDLVCVPGTYAWLCAMLRAYAGDQKVMSVTAWTHPRVTPPDAGDRPYFDGRAECWVWGTWARAWQGMSEEDALFKMAAAARRGVPPNAYGSDLPDMAAEEKTRNIWAVRWLYHHLQHAGLCLRPPWSMVEHIGFGAKATNCVESEWMRQPELRAAPPIPDVWPEVREETACPALWRGLTQQSRLKRVKAWLRARFVGKRN
jgi:hypothetical protein